MKRFTLLTFLLFAFFGAFAQTITVKSFQALPMDMTASSLEGKRVDQNGHAAALIKIVTTETGFAFDGGTLGIVDSKQKVGEIWVWVPYGSRKISIMHQQLGVLRDYRYPIEIESERTYEMVLTTGKVETIVKQEVTQQYLAFQISPTNAVLEVEGELWEVASDGSAMKFVNFGTYNYRVQAPNYHPEIGKVTVNDPDKTQKVIVTLEPDFVEVTLKVDANAEIWVNNEKKGTRTWTGKLGKGIYKIECKQDGHETSMIAKEITADLNGETIDLPQPTPIYGSLNIESTPNFATVYIDGKMVGETPKFVKEILVDEHELKLVKEGYVDYLETITIQKGGRKQMSINMEKKEEQPLIAVTDTSTDQSYTVNGVSFTMKFVEGGTFLMGNSDKDAFENEKPVHSVTVSSFYIGETEVTQALWKAVMGNNPSNWEGDNLPVESVSWNDIHLFISKLNKKTGMDFRLPTEAEWEFAAKGGNGSKGYKYSGSNQILTVAWYNNNSWDRTHDVKGKMPNELGIYDMSGNVREWCYDWFGSYSRISQTSPKGPNYGNSRVLRGGSWGTYVEEGCRVSCRYFIEPEYGDEYCGFRLCLSE